MLKEADYELLEEPRSIAGIPFDFDAMLVGRDSLDLILVLDLTVQADEQRIRRRVEGLGRALDLVGSRRSMTIILVGPRPSQSLIHDIAEVSRVLAVGTPAEGDEASLRDALSALLPLELVTEEGEGVLRTKSDWEEVRERLSGEHPTELILVLAAANRGENAVSEALRAALAEPLEEEDDEGQGAIE